MSRLLADEGGYSNLAADPGGPTNHGITLADAKLYWKKNATAADVKAMPLEVAKTIYRKRYWDAQRCDDLPCGVDYAVFDYGVNSGIGRSGKVLRRKLGLPDTTSVVTIDVIVAAMKAKPATLAANICDERLAFLKSLKTWPTFGKGWGRRVAGVRAISLTMAAGAVVAPEPALPDVLSPVAAKGVVPVNKTAQSAIVASTAAGGATSVTATSPMTVIIIIVAAIVIGGGALWLLHYLRARKQEAPVDESLTAVDRIVAGTPADSHKY